MRIIFKILAAPFVLVLTVIVAVVFFLVDASEWLLNLASGFMAVIGAVYLFTGVTFQGCMVLLFAFLLSPFGLPSVTLWIAERLGDLNDCLRAFIMS